MYNIPLNITVIMVFILIGGVYAAAEIALVSLRDTQVKQLAHRGRRGRTVARLHQNPNRFLSAVQVGVTLAGFLSAAFGGAILANALRPVLQELVPMNDEVAEAIALVVITALIAYVSIVLGELTAKRLALQRAESCALALAPLVDLTASMARPVIWLLGVSTNAVVRVLGGDPSTAREEITDEEIRALVRGSSTLGEEERQIVEDVFDAGARSLREVMVPRTEVDFLAGDTPARQAVQDALKTPHSRYPVIGESSDDILGFVHVRDLLTLDSGTQATPLARIARPVLALPGTVRVLRALNEMRCSANHMAIVVDEYGGTAGIVTMEDLIEELVGDIADEYDAIEQGHATSRGDQIIDGLCSLDEFADSTGLILPAGPYDTLAGYFMAHLGQIPSLGDRLDAPAYHADNEETLVHLELTVTELDGRRAAKLALRILDQPPAAPAL
jgi:putative hemolysin